MTKKLLIAGYIILLAGLSIIFQFISPNISDPDGFYHIKHAYIYRVQGLLESNFPWTQFSVIKAMGADIWYGFHILLIPFTYFNDLFFGIKISSAFITFTTLIIFYWALKRLKIYWPELWTIMLFLISPDLMYRLTMPRPHSLSLALSILALSFALMGKTWMLIIIGVVFSFIHISLAWLPILVITILILIQYLQNKKLVWKKLGAIILGVILGLFLRPHPWGALKLAYIQVINLLMVKAQNIPLAFGKELKILDSDTFWRNIFHVILITAIASFIFLKYLRRQKLDLKQQNTKTLFYASSFISLIFLIITTFIAKRAYDSFIGYSLIAIASAATLYFNSREQIIKKDALINLKKRKNIFLATSIIVLGLMSLNSIPIFKKYMANGWSSSYFKESALWLKENVQPGEIIFNARWDQFGALFFYNSQNYYINGMDPIFAYSYNPALYWKTHFIMADVGEINTCGKIRCTKEEIEPTHQVLINDFHASYLVLRKKQNPKLYFKLASDKAFSLAFENDQEAIFKILP